MKNIISNTVEDVVSNFGLVLRDYLLFRAHDYYGYFHGYDLARGELIEPVLLRDYRLWPIAQSVLYALTNDVEYLDLIKRLSMFLVHVDAKAADIAIPYGFYPSKGVIVKSHVFL